MDRKWILPIRVALIGAFALIHLQASDKNKTLAAEDAFELATLKELQLQYTQAKQYYHKAVQLDPENPLYLNNLGVILYTLGEYRSAIEYHEHTLKIVEKILGKNHPDVGTILNNLGLAWDSLGKYQKAIQYHEQALKINEKALGKDHPDVAGNLNNPLIKWLGSFLHRPQSSVGDIPLSPT